MMYIPLPSLRSMNREISHAGVPDLGQQTGLGSPALAGDQAELTVVDLVQPALETDSERGDGFGPQAQVDLGCVPAHLHLVESPSRDGAGLHGLVDVPLGPARGARSSGTGGMQG